MQTDTVELPSPTITLQSTPLFSDTVMREHAAQVAAAECYGLLCLLFDIRVAAGDTGGKLMQDELVAHIAGLREGAERWDRTRAPRGDGPCPLLWMTDTDNTVSGDPLTGIHADAAIDAARAAK